MRILFIGDIISKPGRKVLKEHLPQIIEERGVDLCIGNVENSAGIFGITQKVVDEIKESGIDIMTSGNHIWDKREGVRLLDERNDILRPANYPPGAPGKGLLITEVKGVEIAVLNLQGRTFMIPIDCPFRKADEILGGISSDVLIRVVDFHAEATSEKIAFGYYLDGRVSAVIGTHTHVQTADERILPGGTAYITDVGMTGPADSVIGVKKEQILKRFLTGMPERMSVASGSRMINAVIVDVNEKSGKAEGIKRLKLVFEDKEES